ncbi:MAG TPA: flagellar hook-associated protein FlgK [Rubrivivax sp.]|nr:flagellar hook-associated protein FlgK [Rubrivivax sp.]
MNTSSLFSLGTKAMAASQAALATTGHNIANANVQGYSRQQAELASAAGQYSGSGYFGKGVDVTTVSRAHDAFLTREAASARSLAAMDSSRLELLRELETVFPGGEQGVGHAAGEFLNAMVDLSAHPGDASTREVVLARAQDVADRFANAGARLDALQQRVRDELQAGVAQINRLSANIAELNQRIGAAQALGQPPNDLLDQRDQALSDLSQLVQISTVRADDGSVSVFAAGGQNLVLRATAQTLRVQADANDASRLGVAVTASGALLQPQALGGGELAGLLRFQNEDLVDARTRLGQLAAALGGAVNRQQAAGLDLRAPAGSGAPIFADVVATQAWPQAGSASGASVTLALADATQLQASEYSLRADPGGAPGVWQLTRLSDGLVRSIASGSTVDGLTITVGAAPPPAATDRFLLQPVTRAANGMKRVLDDIHGVAAASAAPASNNANALAYTALRDAALVARGASGGGASTLTDAYAAAMADIGVRVQGAASGAAISAAVATHAETARSAQSGVDLDEEAARLIHFQQSYQAAAKILQVAQTVFDTLLQAA